ncbi:MAG: outer membrane beta-barrel protein [Bacteroidaceae bacterium]|nr:outer membrane beta-barrel protein [Bacteroidaceae bacterium]
MKKFVLSLCLALMSVGTYAQEYYDEGAAAGDWGLGFGINMGFGSGITNFGIQIPKVQYYFASRTRAEFSFDYFMKTKETVDWDIALNIHPYIVPIKDTGLHIYPLAGITFMHRKILSENFGRLGFNIGGGVQYDITEKIYVNFEAKYLYVNDFDHGGFNLGIAYRL